MIKLLGAAIAAVAVMTAPVLAFGREYVIVPGATGVVTRPDSGPAPHVGVVYDNGAAGPTSPNCTELPKRGFVTWCAVTPAQPPGGAWENYALEVKAAIEFLRRQPGIDTIILYGHSGGGAVASFYEAVAENGVAFCKDPKKLSTCSDRLANLPRADAVVFPDAHPGLGVMDLRMINPSIVADGDRVKVDPSLDPFSQANGFEPKSSSHYAPAFKQRYIAAQSAVMMTLIAKAQKIQAETEAGATLSPEAKQIFIPAVGFANHLDELDPAGFVTTMTQRPERLLRNDGSIVTQQIRSVMVGHPDSVRLRNDVVESVPQFLSRGSIRSRDSVADVDWCSSNSATVCNTRSIHVPVLFIPAGANNFIGDDERMFDGSPSTDKEFIVVEGALHGSQPCEACETTPGQYANSTKNQFDYIAAWINKRFPNSGGAK